jgi:hypothetical protein
MTLADYLKQTDEGTEVTVWDNDYDTEFYFYNQDLDLWDAIMWKLADKLTVVTVNGGGVVVDLAGLIERNLPNIEAADLFYSADIDDIMDDMMDILAGGVSEEWLVKFVNCLR